MAKTAVSQWDTTANNNTDVGGISLAENVMQPPAVNDAFREIMAQIATGVVVKVAATTTVSAYFQLAEATNNGTNKLTITPAASLTGDRTATFPDASGTVAYVDVAQTISAVQTFSAAPVFSAIPSMTGGAIQFPPTQVPSSDVNALDDYEEGTWTPAFAATGCTFSYTTQYGGYRKVGSLVTIWCELVLNTSGNTLAANTLTITGLPFTPAANPTGVPYLVRYTAANASFYLLMAKVQGGSTSLAVEGIIAAAASNGAAQTASGCLSATGGTAFRFSGSYFV